MEIIVIFLYREWRVGLTALFPLLSGARLARKRSIGKINPKKPK
jgi:hypothetical protein